MHSWNTTLYIYPIFLSRCPIIVVFSQNPKIRESVCMKERRKKNMKISEKRRLISRRARSLHLSPHLRVALLSAPLFPRRTRALQAFSITFRLGADLSSIARLYDDTARMRSARVSPRSSRDSSRGNLTPGDEEVVHKAIHIYVYGGVACPTA